jgi:hypothetical protein
MRMLLVAFLLLLFPVQLHVATAQTPAEASQETSTTPQIEGSWRLTPLVMKGAAAPETNGQFQEFGETYVMENMFVFWARFGTADKDWGLFSLKDGKLVKILLEDVEFVAPDSRKIKVSRAGLFPARLSAGKRILYISNLNPDHVYGWDGEHLVRVLCAGDQLEVGGVPYTVRRAAVLDVGPDGRALIYYDANKPQHTNGWVLYDGKTLTPLCKEGDPLPGMPGVQIKNMSAGPFCTFHCVGAPKLLEDGSVLAALELTGAPEKSAFFHIAPDKTEKIGVEMTAGFGMAATPLESSERRLGDLLVARPDGFVMEVSQGEITRDSFGWTTYHLEPRLLFYHQGKSQVAGKVGAREYGALGAKDLGFAFDGGMCLTPDSSRALITIKTSISKRHWTKSRTSVSFPGLYFWDGEKLSAVPWETALGMDIPTVLRTLETKSGPIFRPAPAKGIRLRSISGPVSGVGVTLPTSGPNGSRWFIPSDSTDGKLERGPQFRVPGRTVSMADVVAWKSPEEALVELEDGFFLLTKSADVK